MIKNPLTKEEKQVIINKKTENPFTNEYDSMFKDGVFYCRQCSQPLFSAEAKFNSGCGWPSFDEHFPGSVVRKPDSDGIRTEIICSNCKGHLGHVFEGEKMTEKDTRHCVNSLSIKFIPKSNEGNIEVAYFGGGCFWCTEAVFKLIPGVISVISGYSGGSKDNPSYEDVSEGNTHHAEVVRIEFNNVIVTFDDLLQIFFEIHDPTTLNRQGNDVGEQYRSIILFTTIEQEQKTKRYIEVLKNTGIMAVTQVIPYMVFYQAEDYHMNFYENNPNNPYCSLVVMGKVKKAAELIKKRNLSLPKS